MLDHMYTPLDMFDQDSDEPRQRRQHGAEGEAERPRRFRGFFARLFANFGGEDDDPEDPRNDERHGRGKQARYHSEPDFF